MIAIAIFIVSLFFATSSITSAMLIGISTGILLFTNATIYNLLVEQPRERRRYTLELLDEYTSPSMTQAKLYTLRLLTDSFIQQENEKQLNYEELENFLIGHITLYPQDADKKEKEYIKYWFYISASLGFWSKLSRAYQDQLLDRKLAAKLFRDRFRTHYTKYIGEFAQISHYPENIILDRKNDYWKIHVETLKHWLLSDENLLS